MGAYVPLHRIRADSPYIATSSPLDHSLWVPRGNWADRDTHIPPPERPTADSKPAPLPREQRRQMSNSGGQENIRRSGIDTKPRNNLLSKNQPGRPSRSSTLDQEGSGNQQKSGVAGQRSTHSSQAGATEDRTDDPIGMKGKYGGYSTDRTITQRRPAPWAPNEVNKAVDLNLRGTKNCWMRATM